MPEATKKRPRVFDFRGDLPAIAYLDPSFLLNVLVSRGGQAEQHRAIMWRMPERRSDRTQGL